MFYIKIPDGFAALHLLEDIVFTRLEYLELLYQNKSDEFVGRIEYLLEDSTYDSIGHFSLRLFSSTSVDCFNYWIKREAVFFKQRLTHLYPRQLHRLFRRIAYHTMNDSNQESSIDRTLISFSSFFQQRNIFRHITDANHSEFCEEYFTEVDFDLIPDLIETRQVTLCGGQATIHCSQWKAALVSLFQTYISHKVYGTSLNKRNLDVLTDPRLIALNLRVQESLLTKGSITCSANLTCKNINSKATQFPLCMRNLHDVLRKRHRLSHHARFYYTLFLKECGMSIDEVLKYWKEEYSKPHSCGSVCTHQWQKDERKFIYSIRHMYGLEGNRRKYKAPSCSAICRNIPGPNFEGGCPFKNFDSKTLEKLLSTCIPEGDVRKVLDDPSAYPQGMCKKFLMLSVDNLEHNLHITSPVQYFMKSIEQNEK